MIYFYKSPGKLLSKKAMFLLTSILCNVCLWAQPVINTFSPESGTVGTPVTITGSNFSTVADNNVVFFGAVKAKVSSATTTKLIVTVPAGATFLPITVTVNNLTAYSSRPFIVVFPHGGTITNTSFESQSTIATGTRPGNMACSDLDTDGKPDLIVINRTSNTVSVFRNVSTAGIITYGDKTDVVTGTGQRAIAIGDLDGDGRCDMVISNYDSNTISVYLNTSINNSISFTATISLPAFGSYGVSIRDLDGDGKPDLVVANSKASNITVYRNTSSRGSITFAAGLKFITFKGTYSVSTGDIDGDGKPDMAVVTTAGKMCIFRNTGSVNNLSFNERIDYSCGEGGGLSSFRLC